MFQRSSNVALSGAKSAAAGSSKDDPGERGGAVVPKCRAEARRTAGRRAGSCGPIDPADAAPAGDGQHQRTPAGHSADRADAADIGAAGNAATAAAAATAASFASDGGRRRAAR